MNWYSNVAYSIGGALLLLMLLGIFLSIFMPTLDRWSRRYFITLFSLQLVCVALSFVDAIAYANVLDPGLYTRGGVGDAEREAAAAEDEPEAAPEAEPEASAYDTLQKGSKGDAVRAMQQRLKDLGYLSGTVDGDFGKGTAKAVSAFQTNAGLEATGIADAATQEALFAEDAPGA